MIGKIRQRIDAGWRRGGVAGISSEIRAFFGRRNERRKYRKWLREHGSISDTERRAIIGKTERFERPPLISVIVPVYDVDEKWLRKCFDSVLRQIYQNWELCIADDNSTKPWIRPVIAEYQAKDSRIKAIFRSENGHISRASNSALELATGEYTVLLDHDDELSEDALFRVADEAVRFPDAEMFYSDEDLIDENGERSEPKFKPDFSPDLFYSLNLVTHLSAYRTELLRAVGGFRVGMEGSQDYDVALRVVAAVGEEKIRHIPHILYHWRTIETSVAHTGSAKPYAYEKSREALTEHFSRTGIPAKVSATADNLNRVSYEFDEPPTISVIRHGDVDRLTADVHETIESESGIPAARALNAAAEKATGDVLMFIGGSVRTVEYLLGLAELAMRPEVGAAGGKIVDMNGSVVHAGYVFTNELIIAEAHRGLPENETGYFFRNGLIGNYSAVSVSLMAIRREVFFSAGGFDAENFPNAVFDADLCLRLRETGRRIVFSPFTIGRTLGRESVSRGQREIELFKEKWATIIERDPFYNPNLSGTKIFSIGD